MTGVGIAARSKAAAQGDIPFDQPAHPQHAHASPAPAKSPSFLRPRPAPGTPNGPSWGEDTDKAAKKAAQEQALQDWRVSPVRPQDTAQKADLPPETTEPKAAPADPAPARTESEQTGPAVPPVPAHAGERVEIEDVYAEIKIPVRVAMFLRDRAETIKADSEKIGTALTAEAAQLEAAINQGLSVSFGPDLAAGLVRSVQNFYGRAQHDTADVESYVRKNCPKAAELLDLARKLANL